VDVPRDYRFYSEITGLAERGVLQGYDGDRFGPDDLLRRAQFAKVIVLALGQHTEEVEATQPSFPDVPCDGQSYPFDYVEEAASQGFVRGFDDGTFGPYHELTRAQLALMVVRAGGSGLDQPPPAFQTPFLDVPDFAREAVDVAYFNGLLSGKTETTFDPFSPATRGHVAAVTFRLVERLEQ
jgi:hypothetical protein